MQTYSPRRISLTLFLCLFPILLPAQKKVRIEGEAVCRFSEDVSLKEAKYLTLQQARLKALADKFGTLVSSLDMDETTVDGSQHNNRFASYSSSEVKGVWLKDIEDPQFEVQLCADGQMVKCFVKGWGQEIVSAPIDIKTTLTRNSPDPRNATTRFKSDDDLYLRFESPVSGSLAVYLLAADSAACLLPYPSQKDGRYQILGGREYVFFSPEDALPGEADRVCKYYLYAEEEVEYNQVYILFSPNGFTKASDKASIEGLPHQLSAKDFHQWLLNCRLRDGQMQVVVRHITIERD